MLLPNLDIRGGRTLEALTIISIVVGVIGLVVVGFVQIILTPIESNKSKKIAVKLATTGDIIQ